MPQSLQLITIEGADFKYNNSFSNITIVFSNSSPKLPKQSIFGAKFKNFFCAKKFSYFTCLLSVFSKILVFTEIKFKLPKVRDNFL